MSKMNEVQMTDSGNSKLIK